MNKTEIIKPIFIIGTGRCGSTIFHNAFSYHPQISWLSGLCNRFPQYPGLNRFVLNCFDNKLLTNIISKHLPASETTLYLERLAPGFSTTIRNLTDDDVFPDVKKHIFSEFSKHLTHTRFRQLHKLTGWPKIAYLLNVFPDAKFIHIYRDGRAVANSLLHWDNWLGWQGTQKWRWGTLPENYQKEWEDSDLSFVVLAAIQWKLLMDSLLKDEEIIPNGQLLSLKYEDFTKNPLEVFKDVVQFCELSEYNSFYDSVRRLNIKSRNDKWKDSLTLNQQKLLINSLSNYLSRLGYDDI